MSVATDASAVACLLCQARETSVYFEADRRAYYECARCGLVFVPAPYWPTRDQARSRYDQHRNWPDDSGYRSFLSRPMRAVTDRVAPPALGLDFGSGPGPTLSRMLEDAGYSVRLYDPLYAPDETALGRSYDFVTCTEVIEHLGDPVRELRRLVDRLAPGGWLIVQTQLRPARERFTSTWRYRRDPTHVAFYSAATFAYLSGMLGCRLERASDDVFCLGRPAAT